MQTFLTEVRETLAPGRTDRFGPLPPLLVAMTVVTGLVDAFSYLLLGHVFVANMTGNVVFLGFAVAGAPGFSIAASLVALVVLRRGIASWAGGSSSASAITGAITSPWRRRPRRCSWPSSVILAFVGLASVRSGRALCADRRPRRRHGRAELERAPLGGARPDDDGPHPDGDRDRRRQRARWRKGIQVGSALWSPSPPCSWARWPERCCILHVHVVLPLVFALAIVAVRREPLVGRSDPAWTFEIRRWTASGGLRRGGWPGIAR